MRNGTPLRPWKRLSPMSPRTSQMYFWLVLGLIYLIQLASYQSTVSTYHDRWNKTWNKIPSVSTSCVWPLSLLQFTAISSCVCDGLWLSWQSLFNSTPTEGLEITLGTNDLYAEDALYFNVSSIHVHELYEQKTIKNDIAILKLTDKVMFDQELSSICLPEIGERTEDAMATVAGKVLNFTI